MLLESSTVEFQKIFVMFMILWRKNPYFFHASSVLALLLLIPIILLQNGWFGSLSAATLLKAHSFQKKSKKAK